VPTSISNGVEYWAPTATRVNPNWGNVAMHATGADSWYSALQAQVNRRVSNSLQFQGSYTWSRLEDTTQGQAIGADGWTSTDFTDVINQMHDKGPAGFDLTQNLRFNMSYHVPAIHSSNPASEIVKGWWTAAILSVQSGYPFTPDLSTNNSNSGVAAVTASGMPGDRTNFCTSAVAQELSLNGETCTPYDKGKVKVKKTGEWFDTSMFVQGPNGYLGNVPRGLLRGPGMGTLDLSAAKNTKLGILGENGNLVFRAEFFNILNRANFGMPGNVYNAPSGSCPVSDSECSLALPTAGVGTIGNVGPAREIQFALRMEF